MHVPPSCVGKLHWRNTKEQLALVGPSSLGVSLLTAAFVGMVFTIQVCLDQAPVLHPGNVPCKVVIIGEHFLYKPVDCMQAVLDALTRICSALKPCMRLSSVSVHASSLAWYRDNNDCTTHGWTHSQTLLPPRVQFVREFAKLGLTKSVGGVLGLALSRELTPVVTCIIIAGAPR